MKIMITGAGGFLGGNLTKFYSERRDTEVLAVSRNPERVKKSVGSCININSVKFVKAEELSIGEMKGLKFVIHCAYPQGSDPVEVATGLDYTAKILCFAREEKINGFINISSQSIYGSKREISAKEDSTIYAGESIYTVGKYATELLTEGYLEGYVPYVNIRMASLIGCDFGTRFINKFVQKSISSEDLSVAGGDQKIELLDIKDAVNGLSVIVDKWNNLKGIKRLNIAGAEAYSISQYAKLIARIAKERGYNTNLIEKSDGEYKNSSMDGDLLYKLTGWLPQIGIEQSVRDMFDYYESSNSSVGG